MVAAPSASPTSPVAARRCFSFRIEDPTNLFACFRDGNIRRHTRPPQYRHRWSTVSDGARSPKRRQSEQPVTKAGIAFPPASIGTGIRIWRARSSLLVCTSLLIVFLLPGTVRRRRCSLTVAAGSRAAIWLSRTRCSRSISASRACLRVSSASPASGSDGCVVRLRSISICTGAAGFGYQLRGIMACLSRRLRYPILRAGLVAGTQHRPLDELARQLPTVITKTSGCPACVVEPRSVSQ